MIGNGPFAQLHKVVFHHGFNKSIRNKQRPLKKDTRTWSVRSMGGGGGGGGGRCLKKGWGRKDMKGVES